MNEEALLLDRIRAGDVRAFDIIVRQYGQRMLTVAGRFLRHGEDRADAVQDAFLAAHRSIASFKGESKLWTWLYRVLVNACLTIRRSRTRRQTLSLNNLPRRMEEHARPALPGSRGTEPAYTYAEQVEVQAWVREGIERLPRHYREVLFLRDIEELDTDQTAHRLGTSRSTVKSRLHRARQALRAVLIHKTGRGVCN
jgi:RNA polymerase sigma-70 factor (ECF subfamily)